MPYNVYVEGSRMTASADSISEKTVDKHELPSLLALRAAVAEHLAGLPSGSIPFLLVPGFADATAWRRWLSDEHPGLGFGLTVTTLSGFVGERWELLGNGRGIVDSRTRTALIAEALEAHHASRGGDSSALGAGAPAEDGAALPVTAGIVDSLAGAAKEMFCHPGFSESSDSTPSSANPALDVIARYHGLLRRENLVEYGEAAAFLSRHELPGVATVCVGRDHLLPAEEAYLARTGGVMFTVRPDGSDRNDDIGALVGHLYRTGKALEPTPAVRFASASGTYAEPTLIASIVREYVEGGVAPEDIVVSCADPSTMFLRVSPLLQRENIPSVGTFEEPFGETPPGKVFLSLVTAVKAREVEQAGEGTRSPQGCPRDEGTDIGKEAGRGTHLPEDGTPCGETPLDEVARAQAVAALADYGTSPFTAVSPDTAYYLDAQMRLNRTLPLSHAFGLLEERDGHLSGIVGKISSRDYASALRALGDACNWAALGSDLNRGITAAAVDAGAGFISTMMGHGVGEQLLLEMLSRLTVSVPTGVAGSTSTVAMNETAGAGDSPKIPEGTSGIAAAGGMMVGAVRFLSLDKLATASCRVAIISQMTSTGYPLAMRSDPLPALFEEAGLSREDTFLEDRRLAFLRAVASASDAVVFERSLNDQDAEPLRPSVLFEEAVDCFRDDITATDDLDEVTALPKGFAGLEVDGCKISIGMGEGDLETLFPDICAAEWVSVSAADTTPLAGDDLKMIMSGDGRPVFSPSQIEAYINCPYRWFVERKLHPEGLDAKNDQLARGTFAHAVLQRTYEELHARNIPRVTSDALPEVEHVFEGVFSSQLDIARDEAENPLVITDKLQYRDIMAFRERLRRLIVDDADFLPTFTPSRFEQGFGGTQIGGVPAGDAAGDAEGGDKDRDGGDAEVLYAGQRFRGSIDRIDEDGRGHAVIIDYKGGVKKDYTPTYDEQTGGLIVPHVQALIYAQIARRELGLDVVGSVYRSYQHRAVEGVCDGAFIGSADLLGGKVFDARAVAADFGELLDWAEEVVASAIDRLLSGDILPRPGFKNSCDYCPVPACPMRGAAASEAAPAGPAARGPAPGSSDGADAGCADAADRGSSGGGGA